MNSFPIRIRGKPIPYTTFLGVFIAILVIIQFIMITVLMGSHLLEINLQNYLLGMVVFLIIGLLLGTLSLWYPYKKRTIDIHSVVFIYLVSLVVIIFTLSIIALQYNPTLSLFGVSINYHWYAMILGSLFSLLYYVSEFELEHKKVIKKSPKPPVEKEKMEAKGVEGEEKA